MNDLISNLLEALKGTSAGTKLVAVLSGVSMFVIIGLAAVISNRPDYRPSIFDLNDREVAEVSQALAEAGIPFEVIGAGSPYSIAIDEDDRIRAQAVAFGSGSLSKPLRGITSEDGVASVFNSAEERHQGVRKRDWEEMELMLETFSFVTSARVRTSAGRTSPIERNPKPVSASVALRTTGRLTAGQADTVARTVSKGLGVERENIVISDHEGHTLHNGAAESDSSFTAMDVRESEAAHDERLENKVNRSLEKAFGADTAYVTITSEWNYEVSTKHTETSTGKGVVVEETESSTERQTAAQGGGAAGVSSNVATDSTGPPPTGSASSSPLEKTSQTTKKYIPTVTTEDRVSDVPTLKRLTVALYVEESIPAEKIAEIEANVQNSVGYDVNRGDGFSASRFKALEEPEVVEGEGEEEPSAPNPMVDKLMRRGVEIVTALVFIILLLKSLKSSSKEAEITPATAAGAAAVTEEEIDPELLARARVEELLQSDPERVGEILSSWARSEELTGSSS